MNGNHLNRPQSIPWSIRAFHAQIINYLRTETYLLTIYPGMIWTTSQLYF